MSPAQRALFLILDNGDCDTSASPPDPDLVLHSKCLCLTPHSAFMSLPTFTLLSVSVGGYYPSSTTLHSLGWGGFALTIGPSKVKHCLKMSTGSATIC